MNLQVKLFRIILERVDVRQGFKILRNLFGKIHQPALHGICNIAPGFYQIPNLFRIRLSVVEFRWTVSFDIPQIGPRFGADGPLSAMVGADRKIPMRIAYP